jgi:hypothetical protein
MAIQRLRAWQRNLFMADECSHCREELARLNEENAALRRAAIAFGSLAERLNAKLQEERRARQQRLPPREGAESRSDWSSAPTARRTTGIQG